MAYLPLKPTDLAKRPDRPASTAAAVRKEKGYPRPPATTPAAMGPLVWPMSMIDPSMPIAEPRAVRLRSAMYAEVADVRVDMETPKKMLRTARAAKEPKRAKQPMEAAPKRVPAKI